MIKNIQIKKTHIILLVVVLILATITVFFVSKLNQIDNVSLTNDIRELSIDESVVESHKDSSVINILLLGEDARGDVDGSRTDTILIGSLDKENGRIMLTSIMRDLYVNIPQNGYDKINHAFAKGGAALAIKTINSNFDMDIEDYVKVDMFALEKVIDAIDGVEVSVEESEITWLNGYVDCMDRLDGKRTKDITKTGLQKLNGRQAVAYCRIRYTNGGDFDRTARQREILNKVFEKVINNLDITHLINIIDAVLPEIETSLTKIQIISLATKVLATKNSTLEEFRIPVMGHTQSALINETYYLITDTLEENVKELHKFIYDKEYEVSKNVKSLSDNLQKKINSIPTFVVSTEGSTTASGSLYEDYLSSSDETPPVFYGAKYIAIARGTLFDLLNDIKAVDETDGEIQVVIKDDDNFDYNKLGSYEIIYEAVDKSGNKSTFTRKIDVGKSSQE